MTTHKAKQEIDGELMRNFFKYLGKQEADGTRTAFYLATQEGSGTYFDMLLEANITNHFLTFMGMEYEALLNKIFAEQSTPIRELLQLGLIKSDIELFKTH
jgi:hypothetical protein